MTQKQKPQHPAEFRAEAVKLVAENNGNVSLTARNLGIPNQTLHSWVKQSKAGKLVGADSYSPELATLQSEVKRLKHALRIAEMEREILKKATAYFARENS